MNIVETMGDAELFEPWFAGSSWSVWRVALKGAYALPMTKAERNVFHTIAGCEPPRKPVRECWFVIGRRGGKDSIASLIGTYTAAFFDPRGKLRRGERAGVLCLAVDREQAGIVLGYIKSYFAEIPYLKQMVTNDGQRLGAIERRRHRRGDERLQKRSRPCSRAGDLGRGRILAR
jgi:hypothetical protein